MSSTVANSDSPTPADGSIARLSSTSGTSTLYATLRPNNAAARSHFDQLARLRTDANQAAEADPCMRIFPTAVLAPDVASWRQQSAAGSGSDSDADNLAEPLDEEATLIYEGVFLLDIAADTATGSKAADSSSPRWIVGRDDPYTHVKLCPSSHREIRRHHVALDITPESGRLRISTLQPHSTYTISGVEKSTATSLNEYKTQIGIGALTYELQYEQETPALASAKEVVLNRIRSQKEHSLNDWTSTPTPTPGSAQIGDWVLGTPLGTGTTGQVYSATSASNARNHNAATTAVKSIIVKANAREHVRQELEMLQAIEKLAVKDGVNHVVRLLEIIHPDWASDTRLPFESVHVVFSPCTERTLLGHVNTALEPQREQQYIHDALQALAWLHSQNLIHRDIKPANIGVYKGRALLLDLGTAVLVEPQSFVASLPGTAGTVSYLAPEMEWSEYSTSVDIWSLGITAYQLHYGQFPWERLTLNPNRRDSDPSAQASFQQQHQACIAHLTSQAENGDIFSDLVASILRLEPHGPYASTQQRITAVEGLGHPVWEQLAPEQAGDDALHEEDDSHRRKRSRRK
ncbi:kinase-like domain-containing protein [Paraphoma chrysanthemicola]|uniref:Kinase-like domain-containing protein n=1 Tax=Paraphoma chrysanthemicola TaxID=798071 RepID=A0A8K0VT57_9PLEO|nr:kinase-like domain-containing protein [Paraphoma chrysanthemicola]